MKNYNFRPIFQNFNENFAIFTIFFKKLANFWRKFTKKSEWCSSRGFRDSAPGRWRKFQKFVFKNQWKITILWQFFKIAMKILRFFKNFSNFPRKFTDKSELCSSRGFREAEPPGGRRKFQIFLLKTNEKLQF